MIDKIEPKHWRMAKDIDMASLLNNYGIEPNREKMYICPFHSEKTPSAKIGRKNMLHCFGCGKNFDTIDIVKLMENTDCYGAIRILLGDKVLSKKIFNQNASEEKEKPLSYADGLRIFKRLNNINSKCIKEHLENRCILQFLNIAPSLGIEIRYNYYEDKHHICYIFKGYNFIIQKSLDGTRKRNCGSAVPVYLKINNSDIWYICEGIEDSISLILVHKVNVVCLNSTSNTNEFINEISNKFESKKVKFIIATDNDDAGENSKNLMSSFFTQNNIEYDLYTRFYEYAKKHNLNDINQCFIHKRNLSKVRNIEN